MAAGRRLSGARLVDGAEVVEAEPGDFVFVPKGAVHREGNPSGTDSDVIVVRVGHGPVVINVDGPAPAAT